MRAPRKQNGHRWRELVRRVRVEETACGLCGGHVNQDLHWLDPMAPTVDHIIPVARGGPEYERANLVLMHRGHNRWKGTMTLEEARAKWVGGRAGPAAPVESSPVW